MKGTSRRAPGSKPAARSNNARTEGRTAEERAGEPAARLHPISLAPKEKAEDSLKSVVFVRLPADTLKRLAPAMDLDPDFPLPVQTQGALQRFDAGMITAESIMAGILRVLAWQPDNANAGSYRALVKGIRPQLLEELSDAGVAKAQAKQWDIAEEIFLALIGLYPERPEPMLDLALLHEERARLMNEESRETEAEGENAIAFECYRRLLLLDPPFAPAFYHAGLFHLRTRNYDKAASLFGDYARLGDDEDKRKRALDIVAKLKEQGYLDTTFKESYDFIAMGKEEQGLEKAREFIGRYPAVWNGWFLSGWANRRLGNWEEAKKDFSKAVELGSLEADTFNELALCQIETGDLQGARRSLERALGIEPENVKIIVNLGALSVRMGRAEEARGFFHTALEIDPDDRPAKDWLDRLG